jgi:hypothetical protein
VDTRDPGGNVTHTDVDLAGRPTGTTLPAYTPPGGTAPITATTRTAYDAAVTAAWPLDSADTGAAVTVVARPSAS